MWIHQQIQVSTFITNQGEPFFDHRRYKRLIGKLNYLIVTHSDIVFAMNIENQFLNSHCQDHGDVILWMQ